MNKVNLSYMTEQYLKNTRYTRFLDVTHSDCDTASRIERRLATPR